MKDELGAGVRDRKACRNVPARVLVVEDHELVAASLASVLSSLGFEVRTDPGIAEASLIGLAAAFRPDVVLLDLVLGASGIDGVDLIGSFSAAGARVVVVSGVTDRLHLGRAARAGAMAIVSKEAPLIELVEAIRGCLAGNPPGAVARTELLRELEEREAGARRALEAFGPLTPREREVLVLLAGGMSPKGIAQRSHLKVGTIRSQIHSILAKLNVESQREAISLAFRTGWLAAAYEEAASSPPGRRSPGPQELGHSGTFSSRVRLPDTAVGGG